MKKIMFALNLPLCFVIPAVAEFGLSESHPRYTMLYTLLYCCDTLFFINFLSMYSLVRTTVLAINYLPASNTIEMTTFNRLLSKVNIQLKPTQITRCPKGIIN
jgi:hypothetical protein